MRPEIFSQYSEAGQRSFARLTALSEIQARVLHRLGEVQMKMAALGFEGGAEQARLLLSGNTNYQELFDAETALATDLGKRLSELGQDTAEILAESREEYLGWFAENMKAAKPAPAKAPAAAKPTQSKPSTKRSSAKKAA